MATMAVVRGPRTPRMDAICFFEARWCSADVPSQMPMIVPTLQLAGIMELPSRGSKATEYCSCVESWGERPALCDTAFSPSSSSLEAEMTEGQVRSAEWMISFVARSTLSWASPEVFVLPAVWMSWESRRHCAMDVIECRRVGRTDVQRWVRSFCGILSSRYFERGSGENIFVMVNVIVFGCCVYMLGMFLVLNLHFDSRRGSRLLGTHFLLRGLFLELLAGIRLVMDRMLYYDCIKFLTLE